MKKITKILFVVAIMFIANLTIQVSAKEISLMEVEDVWGETSYPEIIEDEFSPLKGEDLMKGSHLQIAGDISYNQSFISKYEMYNSFSLMKQF